MNDLDPSADERLGGESSTPPTDVGEPGAETPTVDEPIVDTPTTGEPTADTPTTDAPTTDVPATAAPATAARADTAPAPTAPSAGAPTPGAVTPGGPTSGGPTPGASTPPAPTPVPADPAADAAARRNWAAAGHWSALAAAFFGGFAFLGPLVVWLVKRDQDRWVAAHAVEALNFQLTWFLGAIAATVVGFVLTLVTVGFALLAILPLALVALVAWVVLPIRAALAAARAEEFRYPLTIRLVQV